MHDCTKAWQISVVVAKCDRENNHLYIFQRKDLQTKCKMIQFTHESDYKTLFERSEGCWQLIAL